MGMSEGDGFYIVSGSGNPLADLDVSELPALDQLKATLVARLLQRMRSKKLTEKQAAAEFGVEPSDINDLLNHNIDTFSIEELEDMIKAGDGVPVVGAEVNWNSSDHASAVE